MSVAQKYNHVHYLKANGRLQSARITNVDSPTQLDLQIGHHTTILNVVKWVSGSLTGKYRKTN